MTKEVTLDEVLTWAFGYAKAGYVAKRNESRWKSLHPLIPMDFNRPDDVWMNDVIKIYVGEHNVEIRNETKDTDPLRAGSDSKVEADGPKDEGNKDHPIGGDEPAGDKAPRRKAVVKKPAKGRKSGTRRKKRKPN